MSRTLLKRLLFGMIFAAIIGYALYQSRNLFYGAQITVISPAEADSVVTDPLLTVSGTAARISRITLDDNQIFTDPAGHFSEKIALAPGVNIIKIEVEDRFHQKASRLLNVYCDCRPIAIPSSQNATSTENTLPQSASSSPDAVR